MTTERRAPGTDLWAGASADFRAWCDGDEGAVDDLVRRLTPVLWHVVRAYGLPTHTAEDVVQDTWLALTRARERITDPDAVSSWLLTTARRAAWRARSTRVVPTVEMSDDWFGAAESPEAAVVRSDDGSHLWWAVRSLPERCRRLMRIVAFDDRPDYRLTATELGMPVGSIGPTRRRCLDKLRALLEGPVHDA